MKPSIVIIGAGSVEFTRELLGDIFSFPELGTVRVVLHDIDTERLETAEAIARATAREAGVQPEVVATADRRRALDGADYVINVIQVGMHEATVRDFEIPAKYGLNQTIADTIGIGGIFRGLRTFPVLAGIAKDIPLVEVDDETGETTVLKMLQVYDVGRAINPTLVEGQIPDQMASRHMTREQVMNDVLLAAQPTKKFVTVDQVAALALFLCRDEAASITGANLSMDGGWTAA